MWGGRRLLEISLGTWLGYGRTAEATLAFVAGLWGLLLLFQPDAQWDSKATYDVAAQGYGHLVALPLITKALFTAAGLFGNINGWSSSRYLRLFGALLGSFIWAWLLTKFWYVGTPFSFGAVCSFAFFFLSVRIAGMALANLPRSGSQCGTGSNGL